jgi:D-alanine transaminase
MEMSAEFVYLNGRMIPRCQAKLDIEDRSTLFADGVYEVIRYFDGLPFEMTAHVERLQRSLDGLRIAMPLPMSSFVRVSNELVARNGLRDAKLYWQITRGSAPREHGFPPAGTMANMFAMAYPLPGILSETSPRAMVCMTATDDRWSHPWIKSVCLLPNILAKQRARDAGCDEAIFVRDGRVTEGTSTNVMIVDGRTIRTHPTNQWILPGITRAVLLKLAAAAGYRVEEHAFTVAEMLAADEVLIASTTMNVGSAVRIDGRTIGKGQPGDVAKHLLQTMHTHILDQCQRDSATSPTR